MAHGFKIEEKSLRQTRSALRLYEKATGKLASEVLNRFMRNALFWSIRFTKKTKRARIRKEVNPKKSGILWAQAAKAGFRRGTGIAKEVQKRFNNRIKSAAYIAAGFINASKHFGGSGGSAVVTVKPGGKASRGKGSKARPSFLVASFTNESDAASEIGGPAVEKAFLHVARDMEKYAQRKMQKEADKFSAKRSRR